MYTHPLTIALLATERQRRIASDARSQRVRRELRRIRAAQRDQATGVTHTSAARTGFVQRHEHPEATFGSA